MQNFCAIHPAVRCHFRKTLWGAPPSLARVKYVLHCPTSHHIKTSLAKDTGDVCLVVFGHVCMLYADFLHLDSDIRLVENNALHGARVAVKLAELKRMK